MTRTHAELARLAAMWERRREDWPESEWRGIELALCDYLLQEVRELMLATGKIPRDEYEKRFRSELERIAALTMSKNSNYANDEDALANFRLIEHLSNGAISTEHGLLTRMSDKLQRLVNLSLGAQNNHESKVDNYRDLAVYSLIGLINEELRNEVPF